MPGRVFAIIGTRIPQTRQKLTSQVETRSLLLGQLHARENHIHLAVPPALCGNLWTQTNVPRNLKVPLFLNLPSVQKPCVGRLVVPASSLLPERASPGHRHDTCCDYSTSTSSATLGQMWLQNTTSVGDRFLSGSRVQLHRTLQLLRWRPAVWGCYSGRW